MIETCPHCGTRVIPTQDGTCPSCRKPLSAQTLAAAAAPLSIPDEALDEAEQDSASETSVAVLVPVPLVLLPFAWLFGGFFAAGANAGSSKDSGPKRRCPKCGRENALRARVCPRCETRLRED